MKYKIAVYGSSAGEVEVVREKAEALGHALAKADVIVMTGACDGIPYMVADIAAKDGAEVWGYSSEVDLEALKKLYPGKDHNFYTKLFYVSQDYEFVSNQEARRKYRNVSSTANADAGIIISGRWGTMNEFTNLHDMGKVIGVMTGTGGIADELEGLLKKIHKPRNAKIIFKDSPEELVKSIIQELDTRS